MRKGTAQGDFAYLSSTDNFGKFLRKGHDCSKTTCPFGALLALFLFLLLGGLSLFGLARLGLLARLEK